MLNSLKRQKIVGQRSLLISLTLLLLTPLFFVEAQQSGLVPCTGLGAEPCTIWHLVTLLQGIYNWLLGLSSFVAMIFLLWGGIQMFSPSPASVEGGKKTLTYAITGLVIILAGYLIVNTTIIVLSGNSKDIVSLLNPLSGN